MKATKKGILLILSAALVIILVILPFTNIFAGSYYDFPSQTGVEYEDPQPAESLLPSTASTKESEQSGGTFQQPDPSVEQPGTATPEPNRVIKQPDLNIQQPLQGAQEPNTTQQPVQKRPQSYPAVHYSGDHQMNKDYEWYNSNDDWDKERRDW